MQQPQYEEIDSDEDITPEESRIIENDTSAYNEISLNEKLIEPSSLISKELASRNFQLGNIEKGMEFTIISDNIDTALNFKQIPKAFGGWLSHDIGDNMLRRIDIILLLSNSKGGKLREIIATRKNIIQKNVSKGKIEKTLGRGLG